MKTIKRYSTAQSQPNSLLRLILTPILLLAGIAIALLFSALFAAMLIPAVGIGYILWKRIKTQSDDTIEAEFKEIKADQDKP
jgi:hypothetical protein